MSAFTDLLDETFDARTCPLTAKAFLGHRFVLPNYRAPHYFNQDECNRMALMNLILLGMPESEGKIDEVTRGTVCNVLQALNCGRPTLFLERELGSVLLDSHLPRDLDTSDIKRPFPSLRIMLPRDLLTIKRNGLVSSMMHLDIGFLDGNVDVRCPGNIAAELDWNALKRWGTNLNGRFWLSRMSFAYDETCLILSGSLDKGETDYAPTAYGITKPWNGLLSGLDKYRGNLQTDWPSDETDHVFLAKMENLALNILLLLSRTPLEYMPETLRREKREGKRIMPALLKAKWVGDCMVRAKRAGWVKGELNGYHVSAHWRRAHWVRQPCGPRWSLRRLIWLMPVHVGKEAA